MVFLENADVDGVLAYHDEEGNPLSKVFVKTVQDAGASLSVAASHELVEMLADPLCVSYAVSGDPQTLYALEPADAVEDDSLGFMVGGFLMSDFVYPAWFDASAAGRPGTKFDRQGVIVGPFELHSGGYAITLHGGAVNQVFGTTAKANAFAIEDRRGHRSEVRRALSAGLHGRRAVIFLNDLELKADPAPDYWCLIAPLAFMDPVFGTHVVPIGFRTDLASDRILANIPCMSPDGTSRRGAVAHDFAYRALRANGKDWCDRLLRAGLLADGTSASAAWAFYWGVRLFGKPFWDADGRPMTAGDFDTAANYQARLASPGVSATVALPA